MRNPQALQGPADGRLHHSETTGYQPVSRIGEVVLTSFVDPYEHSTLPTSITVSQVDKKAVDAHIAADPTKAGQEINVFEMKPHFFEWASCLPGQIAISRKARNTAARTVSTADTAVPVITSCACLTQEDEDKFYFAGIVRSKSVRTIDDGAGPEVDEYFTLAISAQAGCRGWGFACRL